MRRDDRGPAARVDVAPTFGVFWWLLVSSLVALTQGCVEDRREAESETAAIFDLAAAARGDVTAVPFPSDVYRDEEGRIVLGTVPGAREGPQLDAIRRLVALRDGFCTTCAVHFAIEGSLDPASLPGTRGPFEEATANDPIVLVDADPDSPERGRLVPLRVHYHVTAGLIAVRPVAGVVLARGRRYVAALTTDVHGSDGLPLKVSDDFRALRDGGVSSELIEPARAIVEPAIAELERIGIERQRVVAVAPFTTGDPSQALQRVAELERGGSAPAFSVDRIFTPAELDELLGVPSESRPGIDIPPAAGVDGTRSIPHETTALVVAGTFDAPRLVEGEGDDVGAVRRDSEGEIVSGPSQDVPYVLIVPEGVDTAQLPVALALHGFNSSRVLGFALADTAGLAGVAVLAIDHFQHGDRAASAEDALHAMRGDLEGSDGFAETSPIDVSGRLFGFSGVPPGTELSPEYPLGGLLQIVGDAIAALRLLREGDLTALRTSAPELEALAFDEHNIFVIGNSLGAEIATMLLAVERDVAAGVLNVPPGSIIDNLIESPEFRPLSELLFLPTLGVAGPFEEPERGLDVDLFIDLMRFALEPADPLAVAPFLLRDPVVDGAPPDLLVQLGDLDEVAAARASQALVAAAGVPATPALTLASGPLAALPAQENVTTSVGPVTAVCYRFPDAGHGMLEVRDQESRYSPPAIPPFTPRPEPVPVENPIADVHSQIEAFLRTRLAEGHARLDE